MGRGNESLFQHDQDGHHPGGGTLIFYIYIGLADFFWGQNFEIQYFFLGGGVQKLELMFMKHYAPNRCLYIKVAKLRTGVGSAEMSHLQNRCLKISG